MFTKQEAAYFQEFFSTQSCGSLVRAQKLITIPPDLSLRQAGNILVENQILSALVESPPGSADPYLGVFSYRTILKHFIEHFSSCPSPTFSPPSSSPLEPDNSRGVLDALYPTEKTVGEYVREQGKGYACVREDQTLLDAVRILATGIHRVSVMDRHSGKAVGILSQSSLINSLAEKVVNDKTMQAALGKSIESFGLGRGAVLFVYENQTVVEAMEMMYRANLSALAVLDADKKIVGNISLSDVKHIFKTNHMMIRYTCEDFLKYVRVKVSLEHRGMDTFPYFPVKTTTSLSTVVRKLAATKVHRLWVVNDDLTVPGIVSMTDVIRVLYEGMTGV